MKDLYSFICSLPFLVLLFITLHGTTMPTVAMPPAAPPSCDCGDLPPFNEQTKITTVCIDGDTCEVAITYRHYAAVPMEEDPCNDHVYINSRTCFKRICFLNNCPLPIGKEQKVMEGVFYALNPLGGDINMLVGAIPYCDEDVYCWTVTMPRCLQWEDSCLVRCQDAECCSNSWRICINRSTGDPEVSPTDQPGACDPPTQICIQPCITIDCEFNPKVIVTYCR
ncbi:MAG: hypothetical protein UZ06_CHB003000293 [Chlorobi bacterium OLB6]|nr:MAG: hypothetical protein UZ06_CHB003000293 [Chlorobi bacterium OLB6]